MNEAQELAVPSIKRNEIVSLIEEMNTEVVNCNKSVQELKATPETLAKTDYKTLKHLEQSLSKDVDSADNARKAFKKKWQEPYNLIEAAYKAAISDLKEVHASYKAERIKRDEKFKQERYNILLNEYKSLLEDSDLTELEEALPFERILDAKWLNRSTKEIKAIDTMTAKVSSILNEYNALQGTNLKCPEDTRIKFLECLSLSESLEYDTLRAIQKEQEQKLHERIAKETPKEVPVEAERIPVEPNPVPLADEPLLNYVIVLDPIKRSKITEIGKLLGQAGVTGVFKQGTLKEVYEREYRG